MARFLLFFALIIVPASAQEYWNRITGSLGGYIPAAGSDTDGFGTPLALSFDYGWRFSKHWQFDAGVDTAFASRYGQRTNLYVPRVGYSIMIPLPYFDGRTEAIVGFGGAYSFFKPEISRQSWLVYGHFGGTYAIDHQRKYRGGMMIRWLRDPVGSPAQQWVSIAGTISYNWGK